MIDYKNATVTNLDSIVRTETKEIIRNVKTIIGTLEGEVACDRSFGLTPTFIDENINLAKQLYSITVIEKIATYEQRAQVEDIIFENDATNGILYPKVVINIESI